MSWSSAECRIEGVEWREHGVHIPGLGDAYSRAVFGDELVDGKPIYRYLLTRQWDASLGMIGFIGLNPSTADEFKDDPTLRRCIGFAKRWGYGGLLMLNVYAYRSTDSSVLKHVPDPVGPINDRIIRAYAAKCDRLICAWSDLGKPRQDAVLSLITKPALTMGLTKSGNPKHPLYLKKSQIPIVWRCDR